MYQSCHDSYAVILLATEFIHRQQHSWDIDH